MPKKSSPLVQSVTKNGAVHPERRTAFVRGIPLAYFGEDKQGQTNNASTVYVQPYRSAAARVQVKAYIDSVLEPKNDIERMACLVFALEQEILHPLFNVVEQMQSFADAIPHAPLFGPDEDTRRLVTPWLALETWLTLYGGSEERARDVLRGSIGLQLVGAAFDDCGVLDLAPWDRDNIISASYAPDQARFDSTVKIWPAVESALETFTRGALARREAPWQQRASISIYDGSTTALRLSKKGCAA